MKVISICNTPNSRTAGMARCMHPVAEELRKKGHTAELFFREDAFNFPGRRLNDLLFPWLMLISLFKKWREEGRPDVVAIHTLEGAPYILLRRLFKNLPPCVLISHGADELRWELEKEEERLGLRRLRLFSKIFYFNVIIRQARFATRHADHVIVAASPEIDFYEKRYGKPKQETTFIPNGVDESFFIRRNYARPANKLLYLGGWEWRKGIRYLAESFSKLAVKYPLLTLTIAGAGPEEAKIKKNFSPESRSRIYVLPFVPPDKLSQVYAEHDIFVFPSLFESMSLVVPEAMATGMPVVTTKACGMQDIIEDGKSGFLVPPRDAETLSKKIEQLRLDAGLRQTLGTAAQENARHIIWSTIASQHLSVFEKILKK
jgi:glycosyltransferase involved in cell wall biosynthesis